MNIQTIAAQLSASWLDSFRSLIPKNFKLFLLVTVKATVMTIKHMLKYFWWVYLLALVPWPTQYGEEISLLSFFLYLWLLILTIRPSVARKTYPYYMVYLLPVLALFFGALLLFSASVLLPGISFWLIHYGLFLKMQAIFSPFILFFIFFYLDSDKSFKSYGLSLWRGLKMLMYNYPFCLISAFVLSLFFSVSIITVQSYWLMLVIDVIRLGIVVPFFICFFNNLYIKKAHDQFNLFF